MNQNFMEIINRVNHDDMAKLYHSLNPTRYVYSATLGWFEYDRWNKLVSYNGFPPSLLNSVAKILKDYVLQNEALLNNQDENFVKNKKECLKVYKWLGDETHVSKIMKFLVKLYMADDLDKKIDSDMNLLAFTDCLYDMSIKAFREIRPSDFICKNAGYPKPAEYNQETAQFLKNVIKSVFENEEIENYWLTHVSLGLFTNKFESLNIHLGQGRNGKGMLFNLVENAVGSYFYTTDTNFLNTKSNEGGSNPTLYECFNRRIVMCSEPTDGEKCTLRGTFIKSITGRDKITTRTLYKPPLTYTPKLTLFIQTNSIPKLDKVDKAIEKRFRITKYPYVFTDEPASDFERPINTNLKDCLKEQKYIDAFIMLLIEYATNNIHLNVIPVPETVKENNDEYFNDNNPVKEWLDVNYEKTTSEDDKIKATELFSSYNNYESSEYMDIKKFISLMRFNKFEPKIKQKVNWFVGIKLRTKKDKPIASTPCEPAFTKLEQPKPEVIESDEENENIEVINIADTFKKSKCVIEPNRSMKELNKKLKFIEEPKEEQKKITIKAKVMKKSAKKANDDFVLDINSITD